MIFAKEEDDRGFGDTAMTPTIGVSTNEKGQHIFYWWKPPDDMLLHEINNMLSENNVHLHKEALRLLRMHGGIGELLEDHLEQSQIRVSEQKLGR